MRWRRSSVGKLLIPIGSAPFGGEIVQVPNRLDGADVAGTLSGIEWCIEELRAPEVADCLPVAMEHVQHWLLVTFCGLGEVVAVIGGACRGQEAQPPPAAFAREGEDALYRRLPGDREIEVLGDVLCRAVKLIKQRGEVGRPSSTSRTPGRACNAVQINNGLSGQAHGFAQVVTRGAGAGSGMRWRLALPALRHKCLPA